MTARELSPITCAESSAKTVEASKLILGKLKILKKLKDGTTNSNELRSESDVEGKVLNSTKILSCNMAI